MEENKALLVPVSEEDVTEAFAKYSLEYDLANPVQITLCYQKVALALHSTEEWVRKVLEKKDLQRIVIDAQKKMLNSLLFEGLDNTKAVVWGGTKLCKDFIIQLLNIPADNRSRKDYELVLKMLAALHQIMRLEIGETTENVGVVKYEKKDVRVLLDELRAADPFVDYPREAVNDSK